MSESSSSKTTTSSSSSSSQLTRIIPATLLEDRSEEKEDQEAPLSSLRHAFLRSSCDRLHACRCFAAAAKLGESIVDEDGLSFSNEDAATDSVLRVLSDAQRLGAPACVVDAARCLAEGVPCGAEKITELLRFGTSGDCSEALRSVAERLLLLLSAQSRRALWPLDLAQGSAASPSPTKQRRSSLRIPHAAAQETSEVTLSAPASPATSPTMSPAGSPRSSRGRGRSGSGSSTPIVCRVCEQPVPREFLAEHTEACARQARLFLAVSAADQRISELRQRLAHAQCTLGKSDCLSGVLNLAARVQAETDFFELGAMGFKARDLADSAPCSFVEDAAVQLASLLREKMACIRDRYFSAASSNQESLLSVRTPRSPKSPVPPFMQSRGRSRSMSSSPSVESPRTRVSASNFKIIKPLTRGGFGTVFLVRKVATGDLFAMKVVDKKSTLDKNVPSDESRRARAECDILAEAESEFVVRLFFCFSTLERTFYVMEYCPGGDLFSLIASLGSVDLKMAAFYSAEVVLALEHLHSRGIAHRDIKPDNLLIAANGHLKLIDFGLSRRGLLSRSSAVMALPPSSLAQAQHHSRRKCSKLDVCGLARRTSSSRTKSEKILGTPDYISPEALLGIAEVGFAADWWGLGCLIFELLIGIPPFNAETAEEIFANVLRRNIQWPVSDQLPGEAVDIISKLLVLNPQDRLGSAQLKAHPFFSGIHWDRILEEPPPFVPKLEDVADTSFFDARQDVFRLDPDICTSPAESVAEEEEEACGPPPSAACGPFFVNISQLAHETHEILRHEEEEKEAEEEEEAKHQ